MAALAWTCDGRTFRSELSGLRLSVAPAPCGGGFRYEVRRPKPGAEPGFPVASGYRAELQDALEIAEHLAKAFVPGATRPPLSA